MLMTLLIAVSFIVELVIFMTLQKCFLRISGPSECKAISHLSRTLQVIATTVFRIIQVLLQRQRP